MKRILVVYSTLEGQTEKIAKFIVDELFRRGFEVDIINAECFSDPKILTYHGVILGAPVHISHYPKNFRKWIERNSYELNEIPSAFFSVCLGILQKDNLKVQKEERHIVKKLFAETDWYPDLWTIFPGALAYSQYGWFKKQIMKTISKQAGRDTNISQDYEYTDWIEVRKFVSEFLFSLDELDKNHQKLNNLSREWSTAF